MSRTFGSSATYTVTTGTNILPTERTGRSSVLICNLGANVLQVASDVAFAHVFLNLDSGSTVEVPVDYARPLYGRAQTGSTDVTVIEVIT